MKMTIGSVEELESSNLFSETIYSEESINEFKNSILFRDGRLLAANFGSLVNSVDETEQRSVVMEILSSFGVEKMDEETFLRRYHYKFYGDVTTCQCRSAPYWYCNCC